MISTFRPALVLFGALTLLCCGIYPAAVTGIAQAAFAAPANGSLITRQGVPVGSRLIGQSFSAPQFFWGRPSATSPMPNNASASSGANQGPTNPALLAAVQGRIAALKAVDPDNRAPIPVDLVTTSASGLDPDISVAGAMYQAGRVARVRQLALADVLTLVKEHTEPQYFGFFGEARVNVLALNLALEAKTAHTR
ncbi:potassium-transporting ATPase subunit KdpC [Massilia sp. CF038]|uniref:potassium-transporting ATPase subunit KdpC n=1 Tax=Massilia sp. CF038 TaxID=1881045 RepID=UPI000921A05E|nr:potassium-transporting ATPase subunit KdpC [Massilia sp. CF038]SHH19827.1 K+-transporting ATPase ATPase C chain [Massilia sp. CF038]